MSSWIKACSLLLVASASGCALTMPMPEFHRDISAVAMRHDDGVILPAPRKYAHRRPITITDDSTNTQRRVAITTHPGQHFLWMQRPRLTFYYDVVKNAGGRPAIVSLLFRTVEPQYTDSYRLTTNCDGALSTINIQPAHSTDLRVMASSSVLTYDIPLGDFAALLRCHDLVVDVGGLATSFTAEQLDGLRDFASRMEAVDR